MAYGFSTDEKYTGVVDRISGSGNGIIETRGNHHINLGKVSESKVGMAVTFIYKHGQKGVLLEPERIEEAVPVEDVKFRNRASSTSGKSRSSSYMDGRANHSRSRDNPMTNQSDNKNNLLNGKL